MGIFDTYLVHSAQTGSACCKPNFVSSSLLQLLRRPLNMTHRARITAVDEAALRCPLEWSRPEFSAEDGIGPMGKLSHLGEIALAFGFFDNEANATVGSGVMIGPGMLLTATHVVEETKAKAGFAFSFPGKNKMRIWAPK